MLGTYLLLSSHIGRASWAMTMIMAILSISLDLWGYFTSAEVIKKIDRPQFEVQRCFHFLEKQFTEARVDGHRSSLHLAGLEAMNKDVLTAFKPDQLDSEKMTNRPAIQSGSRISQFFVADLMTGRADVPGVRFTDLSSFHTVQDEEATRLQGFHFVFDEETKHCKIDKEYLKALEKGNRIVAKVIRFLETPSIAQSRPLITTDNAWKEITLSRLSIEGAALIGGPPCEGHARNIEGISSFHKMDFDFGTTLDHINKTQLRSSQLIHFSCPTLQADERLFGSDREPEFDRINIVSGICLYNSNIMQRSQTVDGVLRMDQLSSTKPTLYEMEYIARSSTAIADFASHILLNSRNADQSITGGNLPVCINLDVPSFHYYGAIDKLVAESEITKNEALQWLEHITSRSEKITEVFKRAITTGVKTRLGTENLPRNLSFSISPGRTSVVWSCLQNALRNDKSPNIQDTLERLSNECDDSWNLFLSFLPVKEHPQTFRDLGYTFYVYQCIRPALMRTAQTNTTDSMPLKKQRQLLLSVDDVVERKIYSRAQKLLKKIRRSPQESIPHTELVEAYLSRRVFVNGNKAGSNLYLDDPSPEKPRLLRSKSQKILQLGEHCCQNEDEDADGPSMDTLELDPFDIITALYGEDQAGSLRSLFAEVGLA